MGTPWDCGHRGLGQETEPDQSPFFPGYFISPLPKLPCRWGKLLAGLISWMQGTPMGIYAGPLGSQLAPGTPMEPKTRATVKLWAENDEHNPLHPVPPPSTGPKGQRIPFAPTAHPGFGWPSWLQTGETEAHPSAHSRTGGSRASGWVCKPIV